MLSEKGSLKETPAIKLLLTIFEQGLTGILYIKREDILKVLYFNRGKMIWAISNSDIDKLENILIAKDLVNPETMQQVKKQSRVTDSIGKLLVEKGLITLEELIESTKIQLKRIIISVLKWKDGGFQFIKDAPPERLLSLDLDITQFIVDFIVDEVELSEIWKKIGSLQVEFIKNPNEQKISRYHLSDKQIQLLNNFDGEKKLETILSKHSSGHRESLLKIIYFFLMAELLIKKEFELSDLSAFDDDRGFDYFGADKGAKSGSNLSPTSKNLLTEKNKEISDDEEIFSASESILPFSSNHSPSLEKPQDDEFIETQQSKEVKKEIDIANTTQNQDNSYIFKEESPKKKTMKRMTLPIPSTAVADNHNEKKKKKFINVTLIMVFISLIIGGIIFILLGLLKSTDEMSVSLTPVKNSDTKDIITFEEKSPAEVKQEITGSKADKSGETEPKEKDKIDTNINATDQEQGDQPEKKGDPETKKQDKPTEQKKKKEKVTPKQSEIDQVTEKTGKSAKDYFHERSFYTAADVWRRELLKRGVKYSVLLEMDCLKESVIHAYNKIEKKEDFFILNKKIGNKTCFLVMWGKFLTYEQATDGIKSIPNYFWQQKDPPEIVEITQYL